MFAVISVAAWSQAQAADVADGERRNVVAAVLLREWWNGDEWKGMHCEKVLGWLTIVGSIGGWDWSLGDKGCRIVFGDR